LVTTATTPGMFDAAAGLMLVIVAWAMGEYTSRR
jgi:hypothetical protein